MHCVAGRKSPGQGNMGNVQPVQCAAAKAANWAVMAGLAALLATEIEQPFPQSDVGRYWQSVPTTHDSLLLSASRLVTNAA
jgi:hypothetical protein